MSKFHTYMHDGQPAAIIDLDRVIAIKAPPGAELALVQLDDGGFHLPYDHEQAEALRMAFVARHGGLVASYAFADPDRDDAVVVHASFRIDKIKAIIRHWRDPNFMVIRTVAPRGLLLPYHPLPFNALMRAWQEFGAVVA